MSEESVEEPVSEGRDYEAEARRQGWAPPEEWKGDNKPEKFLTAQEFVERGENMAGHMKKELDRMKNELSEVKRTNSEVAEFYKKSMEKELAARDAEIDRLKKARAEAIDAGDGQGYTLADDELRRLESEKINTSAEMPTTTDLDPVTQQWLTDNPWYETNQKLAIFADGVADRIRAQGYTGQAYFNELTRQVKDTFPDEFNARPAPPVEGGRASEARSTGSRTYDDLPADAKAQCDRFCKSIDGYTPEKYIANYDWDE